MFVMDRVLEMNWMMKCWHGSPLSFYALLISQLMCNCNLDLDVKFASQVRTQVGNCDSTLCDM
jgi:hypothetical protein